MRRRPKETSPEALLRRRAFYLRLPQDTLRTIMARKGQAAVASAENAEALQAPLQYTEPNPVPPFKFSTLRPPALRKS